jgi:hypothetical protein
MTFVIKFCLEVTIKQTESTLAMIEQETPPEAVVEKEPVSAADAVASLLHEDWRLTRLQEGGSFEPRVKATGDAEWTAAHAGATEVDIANTAYEDLPEDWKAENQAAGKVVATLLENIGTDVDLQDPNQRSYVGARIHDEWLSRNEWAKGGNLDVPFDTLPADEQAKDLVQMAIGLEYAKSGK